MATNKNVLRGLIPRLLVIAAMGWMAGCTPPGPRAVYKGKRLIEEGKYAAAVEEFKVAARLIPTNANVWNYLGLACHHAGQPAEAAEAYQRALKLDHDLIIAHYNLGCLWLEQNKLEPARNELTAFTLHQGNGVDGWLKLGTAQLRLAKSETGESRSRDLTAAEKSFNGEALRFSPQNAEALNGLGLVNMERSRYREASACFSSAMKQTNYGPALLNLAVVSQVYLNNRPFALQKYQEYIAANPGAANLDAVKATARQLEEELNPPPPLRVAVNQSPPVAPVTNSPKPVTNNPPRVVVTTNANRPEAGNSNPPKFSATPPMKPQVLEPAIKPDMVKLSEPPPMKFSDDGAAASRPVQPSAVSEPVVTARSSDYVDPAEPAKKGFLQKMSPSNFFRHESKPVANPTPLPTFSSSPDSPGQMASLSTNPEVVSKTAASPGRSLPVARYTYVSPPRPAAGDRKEAEKLYSQGVQAQSDRGAKEAMTFYRAATQADPSFFEAQLNLGFAAFEAGDTSQSLLAYETALAAKPDSFIGRFNFALALQKAGYIQDSAQELERLLAGSPPDETVQHLALAHLTLANLYADRFHQPAFARPHYLKVLDLDPHNSQATVIRYWLSENH